MTRLLLVRHGENPANLTKEFSYRRVDYPLTDKGLLQAAQTARYLSGLSIAAIWSSPLLRARQTAEPLAQALGLQVQVSENFREMNVGDLESMDRSLGWEHYGNTMKQWFGGHPEVAFPGGENHPTLVRRFRKGIDQALAGQTGATVVIVGHGGIFTHGLAHLCGIEDAKAFFARENYNASVSTVEVHGDPPTFRLVEWGAVGHLSGEAAQFVESVPEAFRVKNL